MIGIDTNILVRYVTQDDVKQAKQATLLLAQKEIFFISIPVILETVWVLKVAYRWKREDVILTLETLLEIENFIFEDKASLIHATWAYRKGGDWSDHLIQVLCKKNHCSSFVTFNQELAQSDPNFVKLISR